MALQLKDVENRKRSFNTMYAFPVKGEQQPVFVPVKITFTDAVGVLTDKHPSYEALMKADAKEFAKADARRAARRAAKQERNGRIRKNKERKQKKNKDATSTDAKEV